MMGDGVDHGGAERWLLYGSELHSELTPLAFLLTVVAALVCLLLALYVVREYGHWVWRLACRVVRRPVADRSVAAQLRRLADDVASLSELKEYVASMRVELKGDVDQMRGELHGAMDAMRDIVAESARREQQVLDALTSERERIERVELVIRRALGRAPSNGA